jgi:hypothetical protein
MSKQAKGLWTMAALVLGLGVGFTAGASPESKEPPSDIIVECGRDSDCDAKCDGPGSGDCSSFKCYCLR